jgi:hypothetical protein
MAWLPKDPNEAQHVVWETLILVRDQLNKALGCRLKKGDFEFLSKAAMSKMYPRKKPRTP